jgi:hypothetical protein
MNFEQHSTNETLMWSVAKWSEEIRKADTNNALANFNDVISGKDAPSQDQQQHLVLKDVTLGGKNCDIYHWGQEEENKKETHSVARVYVHIKN